MGAYGFAVFTVIGVIAMRSAAAAMSEASLAVGRELESMRDVLGATKTVELNGQTMFVSTAVVPMSVKEVLDRFQNECDSNPSNLARAPDEFLQAANPPVAPVRLSHLGALRKEDVHDGVIGCFVGRAGSRIPVKQLVEELKATRDFGLIGDAIFVYAQAAGPGKTHVIATSTRGTFKAFDMFPGRGDAPGTDSDLAVRPPNSRRVLSAVAPGVSCGVRIYESADPPEVLLAALDTAMVARGFTRTAGAGDGHGAHLFMHSSGVNAVASVGKAEGRTLVSIAEMGSMGQTGGKGVKVQ